MWRYIAYPVLVGTLILTFLQIGLAMTFANWLILENQQGEQSATQDIYKLRQLQPMVVELSEVVGQINESIPGVSTEGYAGLSQDLTVALIEHDYVTAESDLRQLKDLALSILAEQEQLMTVELTRIMDQLVQNQAEMALILADQSVLPADFATILNSSDTSLRERYEQGQNWLEASAVSIRARRATMAEAVKQILVKKSDLTLSMYEDGTAIYTMPVSLGRPGMGTRSGDFTILDKLGTVWGAWRIWLPYWMGIYFAGSSENGIHGLPYGSSGVKYWKSSIGKANVTYGCVMPDDPNMIKLYEWADVGTPVTIVN